MTTMPEAVEAPASTRQIVWLLVLVNLSVPALVLFQRTGNGLSDSANIWVGWICATVLTASLLVGMHRRLPVDGRQISRSIVLISLGLVTLSGFITTIAIAVSPGDNYLTVALSGTPLSEVKPIRKRLIVELLRQNKAASDENNRVAASMKPISPSLYSVASFASRAAMESTSTQLGGAYEIDQAYAAGKQKVRRAFHEKMQKVDPEYLKDFDANMRNDDSLEASIEAEEADWVASALSLYEYAQANADHISMDDGGKLIVKGEELKHKLLEKIDASVKLQKAMIADRTKALKSQHSLPNAIGTKQSR